MTDSPKKPTGEAMVYEGEFDLKTKGEPDVLDITANIKAILKKSGITSGICCVFLAGSTGAITTIEYETGVINDLRRAIERMAPKGIEYEHDRAWGDGNGFSHVRSALLGTSFSVPVRNGELVLGTWQQIVFVECDNRPRRRTIHVQIVGE